MVVNNNNTPDGNEEINTARNNDSLDENIGNSALAAETNKQEITPKPTDIDPRVETVVPDNDN